MSAVVPRLDRDESDERRDRIVVAVASSVATVAGVVVVARTFPGAVRFVAGPSQIGRALARCRS